MISGWWLVVRIAIRTFLLHSYLRPKGLTTFIDYWLITKLITVFLIIIFFEFLLGVFDFFALFVGAI